MVVNYKFNQPSDMITLAQYVQVKVYWGQCFEFGDESVAFCDFWDYCETALNDEQYKGVTIDHENDEVKFF